MIWKYDFFDIIFAKQNLNKDFQNKNDFKLKTTYKMKFNFAYRMESQHPSLDLGCLTIQVHEHGQ